MPLHDGISAQPRGWRVPSPKEHRHGHFLPTAQREVGEALDQYNFSQVYASRVRLMSEVARACQRPGAERVDVVWQPPATVRRDRRYVAMRVLPVP